MTTPYVIIEVNWPLDKKGRVAATGKGRPKFSTRGGFVKAYTPAKTRDFENKIKDAAIEAMAARLLKPLNEALGLRVIAYMPIPQSWSAKQKAAAIAGDIMPIARPDFENIAKLIDGMNLDRQKRPIIWHDDSQIISAQVLKIYHERPRLRFEVYRWFSV